MENNKILIELDVPLIERSCDLYIPINKTIGTVKKLVEEALVEMTEGAYVAKQETNFYSKETGQIYDVNQKVRETDLKNGSRIILI